MYLIFLDPGFRRDDGTIINQSILIFSCQYQPSCIMMPTANYQLEVVPPGHLVAEAAKVYNRSIFNSRQV